MYTSSVSTPTPAIGIAPASLDDAPAIARIHVDAWRAAYEGIIPASLLAGLSVEKREATWRACIAGGVPRVLVARDPTGVIGWIAFGDCRDAGAAPDQGEVHAVYLAPSHWGRGVGGLLWQEARRALIRDGFASASLWVLAENHRALRFYRSAGFAVDPLGDRNIERGGRSLRELRYLTPLAPAAR